MTGVGASADQSQVRWVVRHYGRVVAALVVAALLVATVVTLATRGDARYRATALVIATGVELRPEQIPRFAESVFDSGAVAERVVRAQGLAVDPRQMVPEQIEMDPVPDSIAFDVHGFSADPQQAAALANAAALAFVAELNKAGPGVGVFALQDPARVPATPARPGVPLPVAWLIAIVSAGLLSLALVGMLMGLRRPVLTPADAEKAAHKPVLATVTLSRSSRDRAHGVRVLARRLLEVAAQGPAGGPPMVVALVGNSRTEVERREIVQRLQEYLASAPTSPGRAGLRIIADVDDAPAQVGGPLRAVLVVREGAPADEVSRNAGDLFEDELLGVVLVRRGGARGWWPSVRALGGRNVVTGPASGQPTSVGPSDQPRAEGAVPPVTRYRPNSRGASASPDEPLVNR